MPNHRDGWLISDAYAVPNIALLTRLACAYHHTLSGDAPLESSTLAHVHKHTQRLVGVPITPDEAIAVLYAAWPLCASEVCP